MSVITMAEVERRIRSLEQQGVPGNEPPDLKKWCEQVEKWIVKEVGWSQEVTSMLRKVKWDKLEKDFPGGGGLRAVNRAELAQDDPNVVLTNPPQDPPSWPPS